ncbi:hypothetical protein BBP40_005490 [Aspergillus hancockii]|nr:hypothetical protein BBP40_005490 [Aspergillus hancockii]
MGNLIHIAVALACFSLPVLSFTPCPLLGPAYPAFTFDTNSSLSATALEDLTKSLDELYTQGTGDHGDVSPNTTSFSISLFSTNQGTASDHPFFYEYHYTAPSIRRPARRTNAVDQNSIYRIGGLTQIFTVWTLLVEAGDGIWNDRVTKYLPELLASADSVDANPSPLQYADWESITVGQLASHMAGLPRDYCIGDLSEQPNIIHEDLPASPPSRSTCQLGNQTQAELLSALTQQTPVAPPGVTPIYSNVGYQVLGYIIEKLTGQPFADALQTRILDPLSLDRTSQKTPSNSSFAVIPSNPKTSGWAAQFDGEAAALSLYSTITNLSTAGKAILNSTLLPKPQTNRWLKPASHTSNPKNSLSYPWIIYSSGSYPNTSMVDIYTYYSSVGQYSSYIGLVPDYNVGFTILAADSVSAPDLNVHADIIGEEILPAVMKMAVTQAGANFGGDYVVSGVNSSIVISVDSLPGMFVKRFVSDGTDLRVTLGALTGISDPEALSIRLYPTGLVERSEGGGSRVAFRAIYQDMNELAEAGTPTCVSWLDVDKLKWQGRALDLFVFEVNARGKAVGIEISGLEVEMKRKT